MKGYSRWMRILSIMLSALLITNTMSVTVYAEDTPVTPDDPEEIISQEDGQPEAEQPAEEAEEPAEEADSSKEEELIPEEQIITEESSEEKEIQQDEIPADAQNPDDSEQDPVIPDAPNAGDENLTKDGDGTAAITFIERSFAGDAVHSKERTENAMPVPADGNMISGWYYLDGVIKKSGQIASITGDVHLILCDGATLDIQGLYVPAGSTLYVYGQSEDTGTIISSPKSGAGIGGYSGHDNGNIEIHGGIIVTTGYDHCAGIGTNDGRTGGTITIYGGDITATGGDAGAGIGGGRNCSGGTIRIYGGTVTATGGENGAGVGGGENGDGGDIAFYAGSTTAEGGENGAGVGGGDNGAGGTINVFGGKVTATAGDDGAAIGGGEGKDGGSITIWGGSVTTESADGAGIGGGEDADGGNITINGGTVICNDLSTAQGARIGGGNNGDGGTIEIKAGKIYTYFRDGAGIGGGEDGDGGNITITGSEIHSQYAEGSDGNGAAIGGGNHSGDGGTINISNGTIYAYSNHGSGIGGGRAENDDVLDGDEQSGNGGEITISGGIIEATSKRGFGIGAGGQMGSEGFKEDGYANYIGEMGTVVICGNAVVTAAGRPAGIGGYGGDLTVTGNSNVTATGDPGNDRGHGILLCDGFNGHKDEASITVIGGRLTAVGLGGGNGIKMDDNDTFIINEGTLTAKSTKQAVDVENAILFDTNSKFVLGSSADTAETVRAAQRDDVYKQDFKYLMVYPCDHQERDDHDVCIACGEQEGSVSYIKREWNGSGITKTSLDSPENTLIFPNDSTILPGGWYYVNRDIIMNDRVCFNGDVHLILGDGYTLNVKGMYIPVNCTLYVYGQSEDTGRLISKPSDGTAIGGYSGHDNGNIEIHGGIIEAKGYDHCAAIGSNDGRTGGSITICGGTVNAIGGSDGAAIGGGRNCSGGSITIYGGEITANDISDSDCSENGAGIGGGNKGDGGTISIYGGVIKTYSRDGAGIGGGDDGAGGTITIYGGTVTSSSVNQGQGARIGGGCDADGGTVTIHGGNITTNSGSGAGIGGGKRCTGGTVTISGGDITANGSYGIGNGEDGSKVTVKLGYTDNTKDSISITSSFKGKVTLEQPFVMQSESRYFPAGVISDNSLLAGGALTSWDGEITDWAMLQTTISCAPKGAVIKLSQSVRADYWLDSALYIAGEKTLRSI